MTASQPHPHLTAPLVGRGFQMRELDDAYGRMLAGKSPEIVTVIGSPGLGKNRLIAEFVKKIQGRERRVRICRGACRENAPAFGVLQRVLRNRFGLLEGQDPEGAKQTFKSAVEDVLDGSANSEFLHFLGAYLQLSFAESEFTKALEDDPAGFATLSRSVLRRWWEADARRMPVLLVLEDLHWAGDDFLDLIQYLARSLHDAPIMILCSARPELLARQGDWMEAGGERHTKVELGPLSGDDAATLLYRLLEPLGEVPAELVDSAVAVAGGTPYLLEQMVHAYMDAGVVEVGDEGWTANLDKLHEASLPMTVEDAISARIGSLAAAERELLERASAMGGVFWLGALVALSRVGGETPELWGGHESLVTYYDQMLSDLARRDYVLPMPDSTIPGEVEYAFKHNLERETLHRLTSRKEMRRFHRVVAEWIEFRASERGEEQLEMLGHHYDNGGQPGRAAACLIEAGHLARGRYANEKAAHYFGRGLELLDEENDVQRRLEALHAYGDVLQLSGHNQEALAAFRKMLDLAYRLDLKAKGGVAHNRLGRVYRSIGHLDEAMRHLGTGQALFDAAGDERGVASSIDDIGKVHWMRGNYEAAERFMQRALDMRQAVVALDPQDRGALRSVALSYNNLGLVYQDSGRFSEAKPAFEEALVLRQAVEDRPGVSQTLNNLGTIHQDDGDHERAKELFEDALLHARAVGDRMREAIVLTNLGETFYRMGDPSAAIAELQKAEGVCRSLGDRILEGEILRGLAKAHMLIHDHGKARTYVQQSISLFEQARGKAFLATALRTLGEIGTSAGWGGEEHEKAEAAFIQSITIFEDLGNEIELAASLEAYAKLLETAGSRGSDVETLRGRAGEIRDRLRASSGSFELEPLPGEATNPGI